ncbi:poly(A)-specific ribonuclease [Aspergillus alliaceus]|uniref:PAN2-PAN3 deadenylation complex catalytic subunit PAN2 n=1 Tax=Petromyces alliaceus TaxID=209559 RepID=A0A5N7CFD3_PETAA|nr:PAB-dependent poly(A)-specific ribonuclease subunit pan2 [Aspergillus alliaceus]KAB8235200.1 PAB-dependent poly(A)-specific ribonuclease subunit pan2 [Aspergillus alliaceus]KAE8392872.1 PAB-dependent poly(A)-specific ribonuclease subunit pan2 [Aspergillus alliaceus]KAF5857554.1 poly(A)-specific ribonuclease [Aspergillus burnettii]
MEADWDELSRIPVPPPTPHGLPTNATTIAFDDVMELLWVGNEYGRITSFCGPELQRYTSVRAHVSEGPVRQILFHDRGVISLSPKSVHMITRRGLTQWHITHEEMTELRCMSFTAQLNKIIVAGCQNTMFTIDIDKGQIVDKLPTEYKYTMMKKSRYLCAATDTGSVNALSLSDFRVVKSWKAHGTAINDMDARNDLLVTCGFSVRHLGQPIVDPLANVYDLKTLSPLPPIPFHAGAAYVRMHPKLHTTSFVASQNGQLQVVDLMNPNAINLRQANVSFMLGIDLSPSGEALAINDADCAIHLWGSPAKIHFNEMSKEVEFADVPARPPPLDWSPDTPLNMIGMPYYHERLFSAWPSHLVFEVGNPPAPVDQALIPYLRPAEIGHYAPNPKKTRRNQVENTRALATAEPALIAPKFLSEKAREQSKAKSDGLITDTVEALAGTKLNGEADDDPLLKYSNVEIKYSRFGVDDFDFRFYNQTKFSGLETHIANSFTNALLQLFKFIPLIRNVALHHAASTCIFENCLLCEMGYLFDMLEKANGQNCQATNLLKTFSSFREASSLGLLEENLTNKSLSNAIQAVNRFFLGQISHDFRMISPNSDDLDQKLATVASESIRCMFCQKEIIRPGNSLVNELIYPAIDLKQIRRNPAYRFSNILRASIERETQNRGWCNYCRRYQQVAIRKTVHRMPLVMMLNTALNNPICRRLWAIPGWLPEAVGLVVDAGQILCFEGEDLRMRIQSNMPGLVVYELVGVVSEIDIPEHQKAHLVSFINVSISSREPEAGSKWHLFNDFLVTEVDKDEALRFNQPWKVPCVVAYQVKDARHAMDDTWKKLLDTTLLFRDWSLNGGRSVDSLVTLSEEEKPTPGTPVALDTEFVDLEKAEIDVKADGSQEIVRPSKSGLARVSVLRGSGVREGAPFIDDYITIKETIVDYVTQYSGIKPGDLDPRTSQHNLVPLKVAYKKLWLLLNLGCIFVGHGLASDFRKINIQVPKSQTVDTQYLFFHPGKNRRLSLRYLAWAVFKEYIQEEPSDNNQGHDSIEDARMALRLWKKFQEYEDAGVVAQILEELFREGTKLGFRPPARNGAATVLSRPGTAVTMQNNSGRNTPSTPEVTGPAASAPTTPRQGFRRSVALTPSNGSFAGPGTGDFFGGSPLK